MREKSCFITGFRSSLAATTTTTTAAAQRKTTSFLNFDFFQNNFSLTWSEITSSSSSKKKKISVSVSCHVLVLVIARFLFPFKKDENCLNALNKEIHYPTYDTITKLVMPIKAKFLKTLGCGGNSNGSTSGYGSISPEFESHW